MAGHTTTEFGVSGPSSSRYQQRPQALSTAYAGYVPLAAITGLTGVADPYSTECKVYVRTRHSHTPPGAVLCAFHEISISWQTVTWQTCHLNAVQRQAVGSSDEGAADLLSQWRSKLAQRLPQAQLSQCWYPLQLMCHPHHDGKVSLYAA